MSIEVINLVGTVFFILGFLLGMAVTILVFVAPQRGRRK